jgi:cation transport ATPase
MSPAVPSFRVVHHLPGRIRMKIPAGRRNRRVLEQVATFIRGLDGVHQVEANPITGSVVVHYNPEHQEQLQSYLPAGFGEGAEMIEAIEREAEFLSHHSQAAATLVESASALDKTVRRSTGGLLDLKVLLPALLAVWAFVEVGIETSTPLWVSLGIFSFNSFVVLHRSPPIRTAVLQDSEPEPSNSAVALPRAAA